MKHTKKATKEMKKKTSSGMTFPYQMQKMSNKMKNRMRSNEIKPSSVMKTTRCSARYLRKKSRTSK